MNEHTFKILDFSRIKNSISAFCVSTETINTFNALIPDTNSSVYERNKNFSRCWARTLERRPKSVIQPWEPITDLLSPLSVEGSSLDKESLFKIGCFCKSVQGLFHIANDFIPYDSSESEISIGKQLSEQIAMLPNLTEPLSLIFAVLDDSGEVRDLPELRTIRKNISTIKKDIDGLVRHYTSDESYKAALQSTIPTEKDGRSLLAVKANFRGRIKGIVHEVSQSGQTVYLEPTEIVERNNDLVKEESRLAQELQRILRELTRKISSFKDDFEKALSLMLFFDRIFAVARWGTQNRCIYAMSSSHLILKQARHPLLGTRSVPIDVIIPENTKVLLITGPNTGGKTVSLKTVGLFVLLNQCGFPIPAKEGSALPHFDGVFADLGDEQSLDQSLSTFSGHMKNISQMFESFSRSDTNQFEKRSDPISSHFLILLDELGSGTDPEEGSALAMSLLDAFLETDSLVLATTHHSILKNYGYTHEACLNASMDFDKNSLSPTYRMIMGVPGESCALDIALSNGIDSKIVEKARSYVREERADVSALIKGLTTKHKQLDELEQTKKREERELIENRRSVELKKLQLKQREVELKTQGYRKLDEFVSSSRKMLENLVRELREGEITKEKTRQVKDFISALNSSLDEEKIALDFEFSNLKQQRDSVSNFEKNTFDDIKEEKKETFVEGQEVWILRDVSDTSGKGARPGVLLRKGKKETWIVGVGPLKLTVPETSLSSRKTTENSKKVSVDYSLETSEDFSSEYPKFELDIRGLRQEEAISILEKQLEASILKNLKTFSIIHGKGEGVLSKSVHEVLKNYPSVSDYYFAPPEMGGFGKTIVELS